MKFVEKKRKENMEKHSFIKGSILYKEVMLRKYFDIFQTVIYQYNKNVMQAYKTTNIIFKSRFSSAKYPSLEIVSVT